MKAIRRGRAPVAGSSVSIARRAGRAADRRQLDGTTHLVAPASAAVVTAKRRQSSVRAFACSSFGVAAVETETCETCAFRWSLHHGTLKPERNETLGAAPTPLVLKPWRRVR